MSFRSTDYNSCGAVTGNSFFIMVWKQLCSCNEVAGEVFYSDGNVCDRSEYKSCAACEKGRKANRNGILLLGNDFSGIHRSTASYGNLLSKSVKTKNL